MLSAASKLFARRMLSAGLYFTGYIDGDAGVNLTTKGRTTFNQGIKKAQKSIGDLAIEHK